MVKQNEMCQRLYAVYILTCSAERDNIRGNYLCDYTFISCRYPLVCYLQQLVYTAGSSFGLKESVSWHDLDVYLRIYQMDNLFTLNLAQVQI